jgi:cobalt-zinc-cadmium efflux system outer membrane protein
MWCSASESHFRPACLLLGLCLSSPVLAESPAAAGEHGVGPPLTASGITRSQGQGSAIENNELTLDRLVEGVLAQNPSLAQMVAAWQAASARYPQVTSLEDPMFATTVAPASIGSNNVEFGYRVELSQKIPFPGKLRLRGENALAEASAAGRDVEEMRLQLVESAKTAFYDYFLVGRAFAVNEEALALLKEFHENAKNRYEKGLVPQQDVLQAEVEIGRQRQRQMTLERMRQVARARINTLLHLPPDSSLQPPPAQLSLPEPLPDVHVLRGNAVARRPELLALADRIRAEQAALGLAEKDFGPDVEVTAAYDTIMGNGPMRDLAPQLGIRMNLPIRRARRCGAVSEAQARLAQRRAELDRRIDEVSFQVQEAYEQVRESEKIVDLYKDTILRAAQANVEAARSAYVTAKIPFLSLIEAQRSLVELRDRYFEAVADYFRRRASLERVVGGPLEPARASKDLGASDQLGNTR